MANLLCPEKIDPLRRENDRQARQDSDELRLRIQVGLARRYDHLINYMYLPPDEKSGLKTESLALLYMPVTVHHNIIDGQRTTQLAVDGARQLHRQLVWFESSWPSTAQRSNRP